MRRDGDRPRRLRAPEQTGPHLPHVQTRQPRGGIHPAIGHVARATHGECRGPIPEDVDRGGAWPCRQCGIQPDGPDEQGIGNEHRVECPREAQAQDPAQRNRDAGRQAAAGPEKAGPRADQIPHAPESTDHGDRRQPLKEGHAVGTSVLSRIAFNAASGVTPSSSSSGATLTRWRRTAGASCFTSSGIT